MKEQAELYRISLRLKLCTIGEVIAWCDSVIMAEDAPDVAILEASVLGSRGVHAVTDALKSVEGEFDQSRVTRRIFHLMHAAVTQDRQRASEIAQLLFYMARDGSAPDEEAESEMWNFWDSIDLAKEGYMGDVERLTDEMLRFLERNSVG